MTRREKKRFIPRLPDSSVRAMALVWVTLFTLLTTLHTHAQPSVYPLWSFADDAVDSQWPALPKAAQDASAIRVSADLMQRLGVGVTVTAPNRDGASASASMLITDVSHYVNGDVVFGGDVFTDTWLGPLAMTLGEHSIFAHIESEDASWQLYAVRESADQDFIGWVYLTSTLEGGQYENDYVVRRDQSPPRRVVQPLNVTSDLGEPSASGGIAAAVGSPSSLSISQKFDKPSVISGDTLGGTVTIRNNSASVMNGLSLQVYFLLENTSLVSAGAGCGKTTASGQIVLSCQIASLPANSSVAIHYQVGVSAASKPYVYSTAIVSGQRDDTYIHVVEDVLRDSDQDGVGDIDESLLGTNPFDGSSVSKGPTTIDVMALYTQGARQLSGGHPETQINQLFAMANQVFADSGANIVLRPVHHRQVDYSDTASMNEALDAMTFFDDPESGGDPAFANIAILREKFGADVVMLFRPQGADTALCGLANLLGPSTQGDFISSSERDYAYANIAIDCPVGTVVAHELGHIMGLTHSRRQDGGGGTFDYSTGYGIDSMFATVMAHPAIFSTENRIGRYSNPALDCFGHACGVDYRSNVGADAVRSINITRVQIGSFYNTKVVPLTDRLVSTLSGGQTNAHISLAASVNEGLSLVSQVASQSQLDVNLSLRVDSSHAGLMGQIHVLAVLDGTPFVLSADGGTTLWDGTIEGLSGFIPESTLLPVVYLKILSALKVEKEFANHRLQIFAAYSIDSKSEVVFTQEPLTLDFTL